MSLRKGPNSRGSVSAPVKMSLGSKALAGPRDGTSGFGSRTNAISQRENGEKPKSQASGVPITACSPASRSRASQVARPSRRSLSPAAALTALPLRDDPSSPCGAHPALPRPQSAAPVPISGCLSRKPAPSGATSWRLRELVLFLGRGQFLGNKWPGLRIYTNESISANKE